MYEDGTSRCERYSVRTCELRGWPPLDNDYIIAAIDAYLRLLIELDKYNEKEPPRYRAEYSVRARRVGEDSKKTKV